MYTGWICSSVHASGWHSLMDTHQLLVCKRSWESGHKHRADVPQCKCWVWPSGLIVFALHLILGSPSLFSSCFELESSLQISVTLPHQWSRFFQSEEWLSYPILNVQTRPLLQKSSPLPLTIFSFIHPKMSKSPKGIWLLPNMDVNITIFSWEFGDCLTQFQLASANT